MPGHVACKTLFVVISDLTLRILNVITLMTVVMMMVMVMIMLMRMVLIMMVMIGAPELCSRIPPHFVRRSRSFDFGRSRSCCKDQGSVCPRKDL